MTMQPSPADPAAPPALPTEAASSPVATQSPAPSSSGASPVFIGRQSRSEIATIPSSPVTASNDSSAKLSTTGLGRVSPVAALAGARVRAPAAAPSLGPTSLLAPISSSSFVMTVGNAARARAAQASAAAVRTEAVGRPTSSLSSPANDSARPRPPQLVDPRRATATATREVFSIKTSRAESPPSSNAPPAPPALRVSPTIPASSSATMLTSSSPAPPLTAVKVLDPAPPLVPTPIPAVFAAAPATQGPRETSSPASVPITTTLPVTSDALRIESTSTAAPALTTSSSTVPPVSATAAATEYSTPTPVSAPVMAGNHKHPAAAEAATSIAAAATPLASGSDPDPASAASQLTRIKLKVNAPVPAPSSPKKPKTAAPRRSVSVVPVRDEIYNLPSDDDDDMIECEPDPEDIKPVIPQRSKPTSVNSSHGPLKTDKPTNEDQERKRRKRELAQLEQDREEARCKEVRRKAKEEEKERLREKVKAREREGKRAALAAWKKPAEAESFKATGSSKSKGLSKEARSAESSSKPSSTVSQPAVVTSPPSQSIFTKKPAPVALPPRKPPAETPLFSRATPGPSIDLTTDDSPPAPTAALPASLKRPARPSSPIEEEPAAKRSAPSSRQSASGQQTSQLSSTIFSFLESGEVEQVVRDEQPLDERHEKAKDRAFITITDDDDDPTDEAPIDPKFYGESLAQLSLPSRPTNASAAMDVDESSAPSDQQRRSSPAGSASRQGSLAPLPPSNMRTAVPVKVKSEGDMPAVDAKVVTQMHKGRELIFKKGSDGFFNCIICRAYTKPHPILFKIHLVRCAAEYEDYPTDTSDSEAESDTSYVSTAKVTGNGKAAMETDSDDAGSGSGPGSDNDGEGKHKQAEKDRTAERAVRREKLAAKNATRKEKRVAKMQRREKRERVEAKEVREKKPKIRKENRKIPSLARPTGGASRNGGYGLARVKKQRPASTDDEVEHIDVKPLGGTKRQQPFARSAAVTLDQEHLVVDSDDSESDEDDDTIVVVVRGSVVHVKPSPDGRYSCPACNNYRCKNPGYLKEHVLRCKRAVIVPGTNPTAPDPVLAAQQRARDSSVLVPPQLARTKGIKSRNSPAPAAALPSFRKKNVAFSEQLMSTSGPSSRAGPSHFVDKPLTYAEQVAVAFMSDGVPPPPPHMAYEDEYPDNSFNAGRYSPPADQRLSPPPRTSAANLEPLARSGAAYGLYSDRIRSEYERRRASPSPPRSPPPGGLLEDGSLRTDHPAPGILVRTLNNLMYPIMAKPPPMALMQDIPLLLELLRKWQAVIISDARKGFENGVANAQEGQTLRRAWSAMMQASPVETRYSTWQDNAMRLWHLQMQLTDHVEKPSVFRDLVACYFDLKNRPTIWGSGRSEQKHIAHLGTACRNLLRSVADAIKVYKGPAHLSGKWLENANISVATPVHLDLNHASWEEISRDMLDWADNILVCYQDLLSVEEKSRAAAEARGLAELEHRARLAAYELGHGAR